MFRISALFSLLVLLLSCQNSTQWTKVDLTQGAPDLKQVKWHESEIRKGDGTGFIAMLTDSMGNEVGVLSGWLITVNLKNTNQENLPHLEERIGTLVFDFQNDNEIIVQGGNTIHHKQEEPKEGFSQKRAIVGGTGIYKGINGQVTSTRNTDGTYLHELEYFLPR